MAGFSFLEAIEYAESRGIVLPSEYYGKLAGLQRQQAVSIAGLGTLEQIKFVIDKLNASLKSGKTFKEFQDAVNANTLGIDLPASRLDNIYRTNMQVAYNRGRWEQQTRVSDSRPYLMYSAINDTRVRPTHLEWNGTILPRNHPFWATHYTPNGFRCRCGIISLTRAQAEKRGISKAPPAGEPDPGWDYNPGADYAPAVDKLVGSKTSSAPTPMKAGANGLQDAIEAKKKQVADAPAHLKVLENFKEGFKDNPAHLKVLAELNAKSDELNRRIDEAASRYRDTYNLKLELEEVAKAFRAASSKERYRVQALLFTDKATGSEIGTTVNPAGLSPRMRDKVAEAEDWVRKLVRAELRPKNLKVKVLPPSGRAHAEPTGSVIALSEDSSVSTIAHEIVHHIEFNNPDVARLVEEFYKRRTKGSKPRKLSEVTGNKGFRDSEITLVDEWVKRGGSAYTGKLYAGDYTEILAMGIERMILDPAEFFRKDPDYFGFMLEVFHG